MNIIDIKSKNSLQNATKVLTSGGVLVFPTDTVYGIGCILSEDAIKKLYQIKNRPSTQPTAVLMSRDVFDSKRNGELVLDLELDQKFYDGELTIIDEAKNYEIKFSSIILADDDTIGIRLPNHEWLAELIDKVGPIVATSANKKGERTPANFTEISKQIIKEADLVIKSDEKLCGKPSTIYNIEKKELIRD